MHVGDPSRPGRGRLNSLKKPLKRDLGILSPCAVSIVQTVCKIWVMSHSCSRNSQTEKDL
jgi:hypothetical protein